MEALKKFFKNKDKKVINNFYITLVIGIILLMMANTIFSKNKNTNATAVVEEIEQTNNTNDYAKELEKRLEAILSKTYGVGDVEVMITTKGSKELIVAEDKNLDNQQSTENENGSLKKENINSKTEGKIVMLDNNTPLVLKEVKPEIEGVIIVATGGGNVEVKSNIISATQAILGIESHKIEVLKMK